MRKGVNIDCLCCHLMNHIFVFTFDLLCQILELIQGVVVDNGMIITCVQQLNHIIQWFVYLLHLFLNLFLLLIIIFIIFSLLLWLILVTDIGIWCDCIIIIISARTTGTTGTTGRWGGTGWTRESTIESIIIWWYRGIQVSWCNWNTRVWIGGIHWGWIYIIVLKDTVGLRIFLLLVGFDALETITNILVKIFADKVIIVLVGICTYYSFIFCQKIRFIQFCHNFFS